MTGPKYILKPNTFNAFNIGSQFSVQKSILNTSVISEVNNNIGSTNLVDGNSFTPCQTQELFNRESNIFDIGVDGNKNTHVGSSVNIDYSSEDIKKIATPNDLEDISLTPSLKQGVPDTNKPDIGAEEITQKSIIYLTPSLKTRIP